MTVRILFCIDTLVRGGTELQLIGLIERLDRSKFEPWLLTIRPTDAALVPDGCRHLAWNVPKLVSASGLRALLELVRVLRAERIAIVQTFFQDSTLFGGLAARLARVPVRLACFRDMAFWNTCAQALTMRAVYALMTGYICNAYIVRDHFARLFGIDPGKAAILRNGVDAAALPFVAHSGAVTDIGIVGNMTRRVKRTDLFVPAAGIVARKHPDIRWHIVGDGERRGEIEQLAVDCNVRAQVIFAGRINDVAGYLATLQVGVICSDSEGLSNALIEYMFRGVVPVATRVGGNPEIVDDGITGLLVPPNNVQALAQALLQLIEQPAQRQLLAQAARKHVEANYGWQQCVAAHEAFYAGQLEAAGVK